MPEGHDSDFRWDEFVDRVNNELIATYGNFVHRVLTLAHMLPNDGTNPLTGFDSPDSHTDTRKIVDNHLDEAIDSMEHQRFKEALRSIMSIAQLGNSILQQAAPWKHLDGEDTPEARASLSSLALAWRLCRGLAVTLRPFIPFQSDRLWRMLGEVSDIDSILLDDAFDLNSTLHWNASEPVPLFERLDLDTIIATEESLIDNEGDSKDNDQSESPDDSEAGYIEFEDFIKVEMKTGKILSVDDHPDADKLYVITIEDGPETTRTVCAGLKGIYESSDLVGKNVVYVANLKPRKLRGVLSEGMLLAADDGDGGVSILTLDVEMPPGSVVR